MKSLILLLILLLISLVTVGQITKSQVRDLLEKHDIKHPNKVLRVSILETNSFKSRRALVDKNLFGFMIKPNKFNSYEESVIAYKKRVESRLRKGEDYYSFLVRIKYASDPNYIKKLKNIKL